MGANTGAHSGHASTPASRAGWLGPARSALRWLGIKVVEFVAVVVGINTLLFVLLRLSGDPIALLVPPGAPPETVHAVRVSFGLDKPLFEQYLLSLRNLVRLDFGTSVTFRVPALDVALERLPGTLELVGATVALSILVAVPLGVLAAARPRGLARAVSAGAATLGQAVPVFWSGLLLILVFSVQLHWLPSFGRGGFTSLILPTVTLSLPLIAKLVRMTETLTRDALRQDYVRTAVGKGVGPRRVLIRHAFRHTLVALVTVIGADFGILLSGTVIAESIFAWPGLGQGLLNSVLSRDYAVVQAIAFVIAVFVLVVNMATETIYRVIDPRVGGRR